MILKNRKVLVIGLGISGRSAAKFLLNRESDVTAVDSNLELVKTHEDVFALMNQGASVIHESELHDVQCFDLVVVSPGVPPSNSHYTAAKKAGIEIIGEVELACRFLHQPVLAITGTNGKTTTTLLVTHVLNHSGRSACALGNVGLPLTQEIDSDTFDLEGNILVIELSSFQLETLNRKVVDVGVVLNITPDHLDRYPTMEDYAKTKLHLKDCLKPQGRLFVYETAYQEYKGLLKDFSALTYGYSSTSDYYTDKKNVYFKSSIQYSLPDEYQEVESHDVENMMAAYALCKEVGVTAEEFLQALATFKKPAHRLEFVRSFNDITYYDDSKGTNIDAVIRAVNSLKGEIILIAGGVDKGSTYKPWIGAFGGHVKHIIAIGQAARKIKNELSGNLPVEESISLESAVNYATKLAKAGQIILLSPGCSSYDMFRDYVHRGEEFKRIVNALDQEVSYRKVKYES